MANKWAVDTIKYVKNNLLFTESNVREASTDDQYCSYYVDGRLYKTETFGDYAHAQEKAQQYQNELPIKTSGNWNRQEIEKQKHDPGLSSYERSLIRKKKKLSTEKWVKETKSYIKQGMLHTEASYRNRKYTDINETKYIDSTKYVIELMDSFYQAKEEVDWINSMDPIKTPDNWVRDLIDARKRENELREAREASSAAAKSVGRSTSKVLFGIIKWTLFLPVFLAIAIIISFIKLIKDK